MDQLLIIYASLSHTHYWCEVGMVKVPAINTILSTALNSKTKTSSVGEGLTYFVIVLLLLFKEKSERA